MTTFEVNDMTCGHCVSAITKAINAVAPGAEVAVDLAAHRVVIGASAVDATQLGAAIADAGYTPTAITVDASSGVRATSATSPTSTHRGGGCCG